MNCHLSITIQLDCTMLEPFMLTKKLILSILYSQYLPIGYFLLLFLTIQTRTLRRFKSSMVYSGDDRYNRSATNNTRHKLFKYNKIGYNNFLVQSLSQQYRLLSSVSFLYILETNCAGKFNKMALGIHEPWKFWKFNLFSSLNWKSKLIHLNKKVL